MSGHYAIRLNCPDCNKTYADRKGLKQHLVSAHQMRYNFRFDNTRVISGTELNEELWKLRHQQQNGVMRHHERNSEAPVSVTASRRAEVIFPVLLVEHEKVGASTPSASVCRAAPSVTDVRAACPFPIMAVLVPELPLNFSSAQ